MIMPKISLADRLEAEARLKELRAKQAVAWRRRQDRHSKAGVYFIVAGMEIKIGHSVDPRRRLASLQTAAAQELLLVHVIVEDDESQRRKIENDLHGRFSEYWIRGEWFHFAAAYNYAWKLCHVDCCEGVQL